MQEPLYCPCPVANCENGNGSYKTYWNHHDCGGRTMIRYDDITLACEKCGSRHILFDWLFSCGKHNFDKGSTQGWLLALSVMGQHSGNNCPGKYSSSSQSSSWNQPNDYQQSLLIEKQKQNQAMIVDQNYANDIFMMVFSTLESLAAKQKNTTISKYDKIYGHYDRTDYAHKNQKQLMSQLQIHLMNFQASKKLFQKKYGPHSYTLPSAFTRNDFFDQINEFKNVFRNNKEVRQMVEDISNIMTLTKTSTNYMNKDYDIGYSQKEKKFHRSNLVDTAIKAGNFMKEEKDKVVRGNYHNSSQLPVHINYSNRGKSSIQGVLKRNR